MRIISMFVLLPLLLASCSKPSDEVIENGVRDIYCNSWFFRGFKLKDFAEFEKVTVLKKLTEDDACIVLCEISFKPKEFVLKTDTIRGAELSDVIADMRRRAVVDNAIDYNKTIRMLNSMLLKSDCKITRTFLFTQFGGEWRYQTLITDVKDPYINQTYAKFPLD